MTEKDKNNYTFDYPIVLNDPFPFQKRSHYKKRNESINIEKKSQRTARKNKNKRNDKSKKIPKRKSDLLEEKIITLSEDSDSDESNKIPKLKSEAKASRLKNKNNKRKKNNILSLEDYMHDISQDNQKRRNKFDSVAKVSKKKKNIRNKSNKKSNARINSNELIIDTSSDNEDEIIDENYENENLEIIKEREEYKPNLNFKSPQNCSSYEDLKITLKNSPCLYYSIFDSIELKNIVEQYSTVVRLFRKLKKEENVNIIISDQKQEMNLINAMNELLLSKKGKSDEYKLFQKLMPEYNNILKYLPNEYLGINTFGFINIKSNNNKDDIHFITSFFKDKTNQYILKFRKYILNLSSFSSSTENYIYHIIIPKDNINKIDINFNKEIGLNKFLENLNCEYYFYKQNPGELLIIEPGSIHLSYYVTKKTYGNLYDKYLIMTWNKMSIDSYSDYMTLKNNCINEEYKHLPILNMLLNLLNKKCKYISDDNIKAVLEIFNKMDSYENINNYTKEISDNNICFKKLFIKNIYICNNCEQEIFNFYVFNNGNDYQKVNDIQIPEKNNSYFICINCAYKKNYFSKSDCVIFYKYSKTEIDSYISKVTSIINNKNRQKETINEDDDRIISKKFDIINREDEEIIINEFSLKINGALNVIDKNYENNGNYFQKYIRVDKYLKNIENEKYNNDSFDSFDVDPLNKDNFKNNISENDIYETLNINNYHFINNSLLDINGKIYNENKNKNFFVFKENSYNKENDISNLLRRKEERNESINKIQKKTKKRKIKNVADLLENGDF